MKKKYNIPATEVSPMENHYAICANSNRDESWADGGPGAGADID